MRDGPQSMSRVALPGRDWTELGVVGRASLGDEVALVNSRGARPKSYHYVDPNEDVVAAVACDDGRLVLVCADGHNGEPASRLAVEAIVARAGDLDGPEALLGAFAAANRAVLEGVDFHRNRTTLAVVVVDHDVAHWAAIGDSAVVLLRDGATPRRLGVPAMHFVGFEMDADELDERLPRGSVPRRPGDRWVLVTDGLEEFLAPGRLEPVVAGCSAAAATAAELADALVERAFAAGAGDNVAAAVWCQDETAPPDPMV